MAPIETQSLTSRARKGICRFSSLACSKSCETLRSSFGCHSPATRRFLERTSAARVDSTGAPSPEHVAAADAVDAVPRLAATSRSSQSGPIKFDARDLTTSSHVAWMIRSASSSLGVTCRFTMAAFGLPNRARRLLLKGKLAAVETHKRGTGKR